jgi:hypothetical protein
MPKISDVTNKMEKKIDLSPFFGEEAFITIKRMSKYQFTLLLNRSREGYSSKMYNLMKSKKDENPDVEVDFNLLPDELGKDVVESSLLVQSEVNRAYYQNSILETKHNFVDDEGELIKICGDWFYENYSGLISPEGQTLDDYLISEIIVFNNSGVSMGE